MAQDIHQVGLEIKADGVDKFLEGLGKSVTEMDALSASMSDFESEAKKGKGLIELNKRIESTLDTMVEFGATVDDQRNALVKMEQVAKTSGQPIAILAKALEKLTDETEDAKVAQANLSKALEFARVTGMRAEDAAAEYGKAIKGETGALRKLGPAATRAADAIDKIVDPTKRAAAASRAMNRHLKESSTLTRRVKDNLRIVQAGLTPYSAALKTAAVAGLAFAASITGMAKKLYDFSKSSIILFLKEGKKTKLQFEAMTDAVKIFSKSLGKELIGGGKKGAKVLLNLRKAFANASLRIRKSGVDIRNVFNAVVQAMASFTKSVIGLIGFVAEVFLLNKGSFQIWAGAFAQANAVVLTSLRDVLQALETARLNLQKFLGMPVQPSIMQDAIDDLNVYINAQGRAEQAAINATLATERQIKSSQKIFGLMRRQVDEVSAALQGQDVTLLEGAGRFLGKPKAKGKAKTDKKEQAKIDLGGFSDSYGKMILGFITKVDTLATNVAERLQIKDWSAAQTLDEEEAERQKKEEHLRRMTQLANDLGSAFKSAFSNLVVDTMVISLENLGATLAGQAKGWASFGSELGNMLAGTMKQLGTFAIKTGVMASAFGVALTAMIEMNPIGAILAGAALVVAGSALSAHLGGGGKKKPGDGGQADMRAATELQNLGRRLFGREEDDRGRNIVLQVGDRQMRGFIRDTTSDLWMRGAIGRTTAFDG